MDEAFNGSYEMRICAELLKRMFQIGKNHPRNAPFIDHVYTFQESDKLTQTFEFRTYSFDFDDKVRIKAEEQGVNTSDIKVQECGPEFSLTPVGILSGVMGGDLIWKNEHYMTPRDLRMKKAQEIKRKCARQ